MAQGERWSDLQECPLEVSERHRQLQRLVRLSMEEVECWSLLPVFRYTSSKDGQSVYASLLAWPKDKAEITLGAPLSTADTQVTLLGSDVGPLKWQSAGGSGGIIIDVSNVEIYSLASDWVWVFKLENIGSVAH